MEFCSMMHGILVPTSSTTSSSDTTNYFCPLAGPSNQAPQANQATQATVPNMWTNQLGGPSEQVDLALTFGNKLPTVDDQFGQCSDVWSHRPVMVNNQMVGSSMSADRSFPSSSSGLWTATKQTSFIQPSLIGHQNATNFYHQSNQTTVQQAASRQTGGPNSRNLSKVNPSVFYCEIVAVDSSVVVAQIVGKNGIKIMEVAREHNILIKTPPAGSVPVFVLKGARDNVLHAKLEIERMSRYFVAAQLTKKHKYDVLFKTVSDVFKVYVPEQYNGIVIGRDGEWNHKIQLAHRVFIETPKQAQNIKYFKLIGTESRVRTVIDRMHTHLVARTKRQFDRIYSQQTQVVHFVDITPPGPLTHSAVMAHIQAHRLDQQHRTKSNQK